MKINKTTLSVPSFGTVRALNSALAVSIQGTHIVYHRQNSKASDETTIKRIDDGEQIEWRQKDKRPDSAEGSPVGRQESPAQVYWRFEL